MSGARRFVGRANRGRARQARRGLRWDEVLRLAALPFGEEGEIRALQLLFRWTPLATAVVGLLFVAPMFQWRPAICAWCLAPVTAQVLAQRLRPPLATVQEPTESMEASGSYKSAARRWGGGKLE